MNASLQVLAGVRRASAHGAVLLSGRLSSWDFKASGKQGLVLTPGPRGADGRISSCFHEGVCMEERALAWEPGDLCYLKAQVPSKSEGLMIPQSSHNSPSDLSQLRVPHVDSTVC